MKNKKCGLEKRIQKFRIPKEGNLEFIPFCTYRRHPGIIRENHYLQCREKKCWHYFEFKLTEFDRKLRKKYGR